MRTKNLLLTAWLILPIATIAGLMVWIFVTLDRDRLMADSPPVGAGAGDTGDANALGQWLAGRNPDAVSLAAKAKRERLMIDPGDWPGGIELSIGLGALELGPAEDPPAVLLTVIHDETGRLTAFDMRLSEGMAVALVDHETLAEGGRFVISTAPPQRTDTGFVDGEWRPLRILTLSPQIPGRDLAVSDPMPVRLHIGSVYTDQGP